MAVSILSLQRQMAELKAQVEQMRTSRPSLADRLKCVADLASQIGKLLSTPWGQTLIGFLMAACAGAIKWLTGG